MDGLPVAQSLRYVAAMAMPKATCPNCDSTVDDIRSAGEETAVSLADGTVFSSNRHFVGICPTCGPVLAHILNGHHSTLGAKEMKRRYSIADQLRIRGQLPPRERSKFKDTILGHRRPIGDDLERWDRLAGYPRASSVSARMGVFHLNTSLRRHAARNLPTDGSDATPSPT